MMGLAGTLRLCRKPFPLTLEVINDGPFVWIVPGVPPEEPDSATTQHDGFNPKVAFFRQAAQAHVRELIVAPGQRVLSKPFVQNFDLSGVYLDLHPALQVVWETVSYMVDLVKERSADWISGTGPTGLAIVKCSQAAYDAYLDAIIVSDPAVASDFSFEYIITRASEAEQCKSAIDDAKKLAKTPAIKNEDLRRTSAGSNSFQRPASNFMEAVRGLGKLVKAIK